MLKAHHVSASGGKKKAKFSLPAAYDGRIYEGALYHAVRAFLNNQRHGTHSTKTRSEVSGGRSKPWKQKGTGRARQGTTRAAQWRGGGIVFGPKPKRYKLDLPRKVRQLAKQSALNARAQDEAVYVIESMAFDVPKTRRMVELLEKMELGDKKVLVLTGENQREVFLAARNLPEVYVMQYANASAYEVLWADALIIEESALAVHDRPSKQSAGRAKEVAGSSAAGRQKGGDDA